MLKSFYNCCKTFLVTRGKSFFFDGRLTLAEEVLNLFTVRLHVMQLTVLPKPFCPSVKRVDCDETKKLVLTFSRNT